MQNLLKASCIATILLLTSGCSLMADNPDQSLSDLYNQHQDTIETHGGFQIIGVFKNETIYEGLFTTKNMRRMKAEHPERYQEVYKDHIPTDEKRRLALDTVFSIYEDTDILLFPAYTTNGYVRFKVLETPYSNEDTLNKIKGTELFSEIFEDKPIKL